MMMKKKLIWLCLAVVFALSACAALNAGFSEGSAEGAPDEASAARPNARKGPAYSGDGGKGTSLAILIPQGIGLTPEQDYLSTMVQGVFVGDMADYSAMDILDRQNLQKIIEENLSGYYEEEHPDLDKLGHLVPTDYIMTGSITKTSTNYAFLMEITDNKTSMTKAAYRGTCGIAEFDNFSGIHKASMELLEKMGVKLTDSSKQELSRASAAGYVNAQSSLARGVTAQQGGSIVAALSFYTEAAGFNAGIPEVHQRLAALTAQIETGNIRENVRNELQRYDAWKALLDEAIAYFSEYPIFDLAYNTTANQGKIDLQKRTVDVSFDIWLEPNARFDAMVKIARALESTGKMREWNLTNTYSALMSSSLDNSTGSGSIWYGVSAELLDDKGAYLATSGGADNNGVFPSTPLMNASWGGRFWPDLSQPISWRKSEINFYGIDPNHITDSLQLKFITAGKAMRIPGGRYQVNLKAAKNVRITATDKTFEEYFARRRNYSVGGSYYGSECKYTLPK
jgi:hypothetical protein